MSFTSEFQKHAQQRKRQTHCQAGHPFTPTNTREEVSIRNDKPLGRPIFILSPLPQALLAADRVASIFHKLRDRQEAREEMR